MGFAPISIIDNIFNDLPAQRAIPADASLLTRWSSAGIVGATVLGNFPRDAQLEQQLREVRNKSCAHLDAHASLASALALVSQFPFDDMFDYLDNLSRYFTEACRKDRRTLHYLAHGETFRSVRGLEGTKSFKPFRIPQGAG